MKALAFDFGASSGRAIIGSLENGKITLEEIHRFDNEPVQLNDGFYWDLPRLWHEVKQGLLKAEKYGYESIGVDTWGVDYALIDKNGKILALPYNYRDERTMEPFQKVNNSYDEKKLYALSGIENMSLNTLYQLLAEKEFNRDIYNLAEKIVLMPDLFGYLLTGKIYAERSMASTTHLLEPYTKEWNVKLIADMGLDIEKFPALVDSGEIVGKMSDRLCNELGISPKNVVAVAGHDTQSAIVAVPTKSKDFVYISCGTWSLFGTELSEPCISEISAGMNITNETGYARTTCFLKNIIGLWMIQETRRQFKREGKEYSYADMEMMARESQGFKSFIDPDDPVFATPGNQTERIREFCRKTGQSVPKTDGEIVRCIYESLAMKYKYTFENLQECTGKTFGAIHMVGGGTKDGFLCQLTADATETPVVSGPIEATAMGNIAVQFIASGAIRDLQDAREIISNSFPVKEFEPEKNGFSENYDRFIKILR